MKIYNFKSRRIEKLLRQPPLQLPSKIAYIPTECEC